MSIRSFAARLAILLGLVLAVTGTAAVPAAQARASKVPKVHSLTLIAKDWDGVRLKLRWSGVSGATYQLRWSTARSMRGAHAVGSGTTSAWSGRLSSFTRTWYFQARAIKAGRAGAWSKVRSAKFAGGSLGTPRPSVSSIPGGVQASWPAVANATRYRVKWSPAPWDLWPGPFTYASGTATGWVPASIRVAQRLVPTDPVTDASMTAVPYANPIYLRVESNSVARPGTIRRGPWQVAFPGSPVPAPGAPVRFGSYNVELGGTLANSNWAARYPLIARNIAEHHLTMAALQEIMADGPMRNGAEDVTDELTRLTGNLWAVAPANRAEGRIIYDTSRFTLQDSGLLNDYGTITNFRRNEDLLLPWARFVSTDPQWTRPFLALSAHFVPRLVADGTNDASNNIDTGNNAGQLMAAVDNLNTAEDPIILGGDFTSNTHVFGDTHPAQPTLVRGGYYDAMAALTKVGIAYGTGNKGVRQYPQTAMVGTRSDAVFVKGITGSLRYENVVNWTGGKSAPPSDHNLIYADLQVPN